MRTQGQRNPPDPPQRIQRPKPATGDLGRRSLKGSPMARKPQYSGPWRRIRTKVLERDGYTCTIRGPNCTGRATEVITYSPSAKAEPGSTLTG